MMARGKNPIKSEADMPELISGLVRENVGIYEASVCTPTLQDVYYAFVKKPGEETPHEEAAFISCFPKRNVHS